VDESDPPQATQDFIDLGIQEHGRFDGMALYQQVSDIVRRYRRKRAIKLEKLQCETGQVVRIPRGGIKYDCLAVVLLELKTLHELSL
jgi:hypothetical protein